MSGPEGMLNRRAPAAGEPEAANVVQLDPFLRVRAELSARRFSIVDRMAAQAWASSPLGLGYSRLAFEPAAPGEGAQSGEFLLIYARDCAWSSWGIGCDDDGLTLWHAPRGKTIGRFRTMRDALGRISELSLGA